jgi:hypothetical protein
MKPGNCVVESPAAPPVPAPAVQVAAALFHIATLYVCDAALGVNSRTANSGVAWDAALNDATALGYAKSMHHQMGVMMGQMGLTLTEWEETLTSPMGESVLIAVCVALLAAYFFRVAWVLDQDEQN